MKLLNVYRSPNEGAAGGAPAPTTQVTKPTPKAAPAGAQTPQNKVKTITRKPGDAAATINKGAEGRQVGQRMGAGEGEAAPESAADRAIARKQSQQTPKPKEKKESGLDKLRKLHSSKVAPQDRKNNVVEIDPASSDTPPSAESLERGRPEPKVPRKAQTPRPEPVAEEGEQEPAIEEVEPQVEPEIDPETGEPIVATEEDDGLYKPKTKYQAYRQEHDIPELFHGLMTDPESEKTVHELFQKSHAFERTKENLVNQTQYVEKELFPRLDHYMGLEDDFNYLAGKKDLMGIAKKFGFTQENVLQSALEYLNIRDAGPQAIAQHEALRAAEDHNRANDKRLAKIEKQNQESQRTLKRAAFESVLARDDVRALEQQFETGSGMKPGSFKSLVAKFAHDVFMESLAGVNGDRERATNLSPEQALQGFMQQHGLRFPEGTPNAAPKVPAAKAPPGQAAKPAATPTQRPRIIPNINSRGTSNTSSKGVYQDNGKPKMQQLREFARNRKKNRVEAK